MKRFLAAATLSLTISAANEYTPVDNQKQEICCNSHIADVMILKYKNDGRVVGIKDVGYASSFDTDCDGNIDLIHFYKLEDRIYSVIPIIYHSYNNNGEVKEGSYFDPLEDGWNGNEIKCKDLTECVNKLANRERLTA